MQLEYLPYFIKLFNLNFIRLFRIPRFERCAVKKPPPTVTWPSPLCRVFPGLWVVSPARCVACQRQDMMYFFFPFCFLLHANGTRGVAQWWSLPSMPEALGTIPSIGKGKKLQHKTNPTNANSCFFALDFFHIITCLGHHFKSECKEADFVL